MSDGKQPTTTGSSTTSSSSCPAISANEKWDHSVENALRKTSLGLVAGLLPSLLLTRTLAARLSMSMFTTGFGAGIGYAEAAYLYDHNVTFDRRHLINVQFMTPKTDDVSTSTPTATKQ
jgi:inner membrane organizing system protein 1